MKLSCLRNKKVLITAGPTHEPIDPVRYISNHSSGKMGYALAEVFLKKGADVFLVSGPVCLTLKHPHLTTVQVQTANEMYLACCRFFEGIDVAVFAAAVADYRPQKVAEQKIKKQDESLTIKMVRNIDIAYEFGRVKGLEQISVGFAPEPEDERKNAVNKLDRKNLDMMVLNYVGDKSQGFGYTTNKITIIKSDYTQKDLPLKTEISAAEDIVNEVSNLILLKKYLIEESIPAYEMMYY